MKSKRKKIIFFMFLLLGFALAAGRRSVYAEEGQQEPKNFVKPVTADYDDLWLTVNANGNNKVFYTDKEKNGWTEAIKEANGQYLIDISWIKNTKDAELLLKGDVCEDIVTVVFPARVTKLKAKFNKSKGTVEITGVPSEITEFEWRKATSYTWKKEKLEDAAKQGSAFWLEMEKFRVSGASIYIRLPQVQGKQNAEGVFEAGQRPSKEVKVSISKRSSAPKIKVDSSRLTLNTKDTMEYSLNNGASWIKAEKQMSIGKIGTGKQVAFRTAATEKSGHSKTTYVTIPAQRSAPTIGAEVRFSFDQSKFYLEFPKASKEDKYEYTVVKKGEILNMLKASWKSVSSDKKVSVSAKTAPAGSVIFVRHKGTNGTTSNPLVLASSYNTIVVQYAAAPNPTGTK